MALFFGLLLHPPAIHILLIPLIHIPVPLASPSRAFLLVCIPPALSFLFLSLFLFEGGETRKMCVILSQPLQRTRARDVFYWTLRHATIRFPLAFPFSILHFFGCCFFSFSSFFFFSVR
jgi:hypothetical protein